MLKAGIIRYINNFKGFSREIWILTLTTFINRAGTMVLPFLSKYLKEDLHFSYKEVSWVLVSFGIGSMIGSWLGGKLSDKIGFYRVMLFSLLTSGIGFIILQFITSFIGLCVGIFLIMVIADMYRPAMFVSLNTFATKENRTRALTLVRLAINLGFALGPAMAGLIIIGIGYKGLFWVDGITCILAISLFRYFIKIKTNKHNSKKNVSLFNNKITVFSDTLFWIFLSCCMLIAILFFQLFTTLPLYHKIQFNLTELQSGLLLMLNGLFIFFLEMPIVSYVERKQINKIKIITTGALMMSLSMFILIFSSWSSILVIMMILMSLGEMLTFPFSNSFAMSRAPKGHEGRYMAIFSMSFSAANIISAKIGLSIVDYFGYTTNWLIMAFLGIIAVLLGIITYNLTQKEN
ncbi:MFS transporter [Flavobacterium columnare]|uniref:Major facilitator transporter n=3 Tax=Flavobacterium columnare TaxID=996 RepID=G8X5F0_FLACA|nr:MFS transporter [Flavobacterium columnare]AEW86182.1 major facilitator transporter [Flavobacterium columnare ATCC 49512]AMO19898.1 MFS transporter [Flavobacterium columnare]MEB3800707.1 MFS transporter [Flavobacterium columnare]QOG58534.1 MFS transporter [Flavobacterium columnare]QOG61256.1 MFS transporter [Flavobacterium columnare]